jgi:hypothetical protein
MYVDFYVHREMATVLRPPHLSRELRWLSPTVGGCVLMSPWLARSYSSVRCWSSVFSFWLWVPRSRLYFGRTSFYSVQRICTKFK